MPRLPENIQTFIDGIYAMEAEEPQDIVTHRQKWEATLASLNHKGVDVASVQDIITDDVQLRIYTPEGSGPFPLLIHYPGGAFIYSEFIGHELFCKDRCADSEFVVVNVKTRVAPEHTPTNSLEDAYQALQWCIEHATELNCNPESIILSGDSSGANFAALLAIRTASEGITNVKGQLLLVPATDLARTGQSHTDFDKGYLLDRVDWFYNFYAPADQHARKDPAISPLYAKIPDGHMPTKIICASFDPLVDDSRSYANKLSEAGVDVELIEMPVIHSMHLFEPIIDTSIYPETSSSAMLKEKLAELKKLCPVA